MVVDDHPIVRHGLVSLIGDKPGITVVAEASDGEQAIQLLREHRPDVTLMDLNLPKCSGVQVIEKIGKELPDSRFIVLTTFDGDEMIFQAFQAGASAYILKSMVCGDIVDTIRDVHGGQRHVPPEIARKLAERLSQPSLTPRELDVLRLLAAGDENKEIAAALGISPGTVKTHVISIFEKLGVNDRKAAAALALKRGLVNPLYIRYGVGK